MDELVKVDERDFWEPTLEELERIEELGFYGISDPRQICALLNVEARHLAYASLFGEALKFFKRGEAKAHLALSQSLMNMAIGTQKAETARHLVNKFLLQSRFQYDEASAATRSKEKIEATKIKLAKKIHRDNLDLQTTRLIETLKEDDLQKVSK